MPSSVVALTVDRLPLIGAMVPLESGGNDGDDSYSWVSKLGAGQDLLCAPLQQKQSTSLVVPNVMVNALRVCGSDPLEKVLR